MKIEVPDKPFEQDTRYLNAQMQPALLMDLLQSQGISSHLFLRGTGLFYDDIETAEKLISPAQFLKLMANARRLYPGTELSFRYGQMLWPGYYGPFSQLLAGADCLRQALTTLTQYRRHLSPLLVPQVHYGETHCCIFWRDAIGAGEQLPFLVEAYSTGLMVMCEQGYGAPLPWQAIFNRGRPDNLHDYQAYLACPLHFNLGVNALIIDNHWLEEPWLQQRSHGTPTALKVARRACSTQTWAQQNGLLEALSDFLQQRVHDAPSLEQAAAYFDISSATLKRKLKNHGVNFQKLQDKARMEACFKLMCFERYSNETLAETLQFNNATNFRRAFKRWCGLTPSHSKALLAQVLSV